MNFLLNMRIFFLNRCTLLFFQLFLATAAWCLALCFESEIWIQSILWHLSTCCNGCHYFVRRFAVHPICNYESMILEVCCMLSHCEYILGDSNTFNNKLLWDTCHCVFALIRKNRVRLITLPCLWRKWILFYCHEYVHFYSFRLFRSTHIFIAYWIFFFFKHHFLVLTS